MGNRRGLISWLPSISPQKISIRYDHSLKLPTHRDTPPSLHAPGGPSGALVHPFSLLPPVFWLQRHFILPCYSYPPFNLVFKYANSCYTGNYKTLEVLVLVQLPSWGRNFIFSGVNGGKPSIQYFLKFILLFLFPEVFSPLWGTLWFQGQQFPGCKYDLNLTNQHVPSLGHSD